MEGLATSTTGGSASANSSTMGTTTSTGSVTSNIPSMSSDAIIQVRFGFFFGVVDSGWCWNIFSVCCCCCEILLLEPIFGIRI